MNIIFFCFILFLVLIIIYYLFNILKLLIFKLNILLKKRTFKLNKNRQNLLIKKQNKINNQSKHINTFEHSNSKNYFSKNTDMEDIYLAENKDTYINIIKDLIKIINEESQQIDQKYIFKILQKLISKYNFNIKNMKYFKKNKILEVINDLNIETSANFKSYLITRKCRKLSGVDVATIVLKPSVFSCPEKCIFCPTERNIKTKQFTQPKSYISSEPAMLRALRYKFTVIGQLIDRIYTYMVNGIIDTSSKLEIIISGGTWESYPIEYRESVSRDIFWAANVCPSDKKKIKELLDFLNELEYDSPLIYDNQYVRKPLKLEEEKYINTFNSLNKVIGITVETRPDYITAQSIKNYIKWGFTRVQIGIQHTDDEILMLNKRGATNLDTIRAIRKLKINGFKVVVHIMPDLYGSSYLKDLAMFKDLIRNTDLQFDDIKIYPTAICKSADPELSIDSELKLLYDVGLYKPYAETDITLLVKVLKYYKEHIQPWVRIQRLVRDIPTNSMFKGYNFEINLRDLLKNKYNVKCNCIRCKEIKDNKIDLNDKILVVRKYISSGGIEYHLSYEIYDKTILFILKYYLYYKVSYYLLKYFNKLLNIPVFNDFILGVFFCLTYYLTLYYLNIYGNGKLSLLFIYLFIFFIFLNRKIINFLNILKIITSKTVYFSGLCSYKYNLGFCRMRINGLLTENDYLLPILINKAIIRELHVYSAVNDLKNKVDTSYQHQGLGQLLVKTAENIAKDNGIHSIAIIAGVGVREYYRKKLNYELKDNFMVKNL